MGIAQLEANDAKLIASYQTIAVIIFVP